jgi:hypothetical protein
MTLLDHRNTATTKKLDIKNSHLTSVGARVREKGRKGEKKRKREKEEGTLYGCAFAQSGL